MTILEIINLIIGLTALSSVGLLFYSQKKQTVLADNVVSLSNSHIKEIKNSDTKLIESVATEKSLVKQQESLSIESFDSKLATQKVIENTAELMTLFEKLGYSARVDRESNELIKEMKSLIKTEIIDFAGFDKALTEIEQQLANKETSNKYRLEDNKLLSEILTVKLDKDKVLAILNRNPIYDLLPFIEQIPFYKNEEVVWRTAVEHSLIRKRPTNPDLFASLLEKLKVLFSTIKNPQSKILREEVLEAIEKLSRDLQKPNSYLPIPLKFLEEKVVSYIVSAPNETVQAKKEALSNLLASQLTLRYKYRFDTNKELLLPVSESKVYRQLVQQEVKKYLDASFLQISWLSNYMLITLLNSELAILANKNANEEIISILEMTYQEINDGCFDVGETIRRLRQLEEKGLYLSSFVFSLLRLILVAKRVTI